MHIPSSRPVLAVLVALLGAALAVAGPAAAAGRKKTSPPALKVTVNVLPGSVASIEVPARPLPGGQTLIGTGVTREVPLSGRLSGTVVGVVRLGQDIPVRLTKGSLAPAAVDVLSDPACGGTPTLRVNPASTVVLDKARTTRAVLRQTGRTTATAYVKLRLAFDMRTALGCDQPLLPMGAVETPFTVKASGAVGAGGLTALTLDAPPTAATVLVCLTPGDPAKPCADAPAGYPVRIAVRLKAAISLT